MDKDIILKHIQNAQENASVDFKREFYMLLRQSDLPKDVAAFANLQTDEDKYIIFGVEDETREIVGIDRHSFAKQDDVDSYLEEKIEPFPDVRCGLIETDGGKVVGYIKVLSTNCNPPYVIKETCGKGNRIEKGDVFIRKGSCNKKASRADIDEMYMQNGELLVRIHERGTVVGPIHVASEGNREYIYGQIDVEIFNNTTRPVLICGGEISIATSERAVICPIWSTEAMKNIHDRPLEVPAQVRKIYTMIYDFTSQNCIDMGFDSDGYIDGLVDVVISLWDTDDKTYRSNKSAMLMTVKGAILHKVRLKEAREAGRSMSAWDAIIQRLKGKRYY